jgi:ribosomal protein S18 acetylase RimI-like enzyme
LPGNESSLQLKEIEPGDIVTGFSLGNPAYNPLKTFLRRDAKTYHANDLGKTFGLFETYDPKYLRAYITLVCGEIEVQAGEPRIEDVEFRYPTYPAVKIARLAVDRRFRRRGLGETLVHFALGIIKTQICPHVGCRFVVVDSKQQAVGFYVSQGFTLLDTETNRARAEPIMFIDLRKIPVAAE